LHQLGSTATFERSRVTMDRDARLIVGIDLGTTHTVVAWADPSVDQGRATQIFAVPQLVTLGSIEARPMLPSALYAPLAGEAEADPFGDAPWIVGEAARKRGAEVPGRLVSSAKSWLSHPGVDRTAAVLPWGISEDDEDAPPRISPVEASARLLLHVRRAWDAEHPACPLAEQEIVLTVPASFDEVARELTVLAAEQAGLSVRLLEEPQAAFYDFMRSAGSAKLEALLDASSGRTLVLVCDVGGGTTDLSLIGLTRGESGEPKIARLAVGNHLLLGGDNMDLALAHLAEPRLNVEGKLDAQRFAQLVSACRAAKERLLGDAPPEAASVTLLGSGTKLIGNTLTARLARGEVERLVLDGFFPMEPRHAKPRRGRSALVAFGLPYEPDVALTRHVALFFSKHAPGEAAPHALLLNGGVFRAARLRARIAEAIGAWGGPELRVLDAGDPDLAVARGAVAYGLTLRGHGPRIGGGSARGYYVALAEQADKERLGVCVVPRGAEEGVRFVVRDRVFALTVGRPARFELFASDEVAALAPGSLVPLDPERFQSLPPLTATLQGEGGVRERHVLLEGELTAVGTLDLACVEITDEARRFRLSFGLRGARESEHVAPSAAPPSRNLDDARATIDRVFGPTKQEIEPRDAKGLIRELERLLRDRATWTTPTTRALFDALIVHRRARRRTAAHERTFWLLAGYCLRPGFGHPLDDERVRLLTPLLFERLAFAETRVWQQLWIAGRRVAGGLDEAAQTRLRDLIDPFLAPSEVKLKKPKGLRPEALDDLLAMAASLERVSAARRSELGGWLLERTWTESDPGLWAAIGRIGARIPTYASAHHVVSARSAERWLDHLLREKWAELPTAINAAVELARRTGDRARDIADPLRHEVERRLVASGAADAQVRAVREVVLASESDRVAFFGESLPVGLRLTEPS
jgi:molecular chaperone DnaK (HSP70)